MNSNAALLDSTEWDGLQEAMLFCLATERERIPLQDYERRWIEFRQYIVDQNGELIHESRLVSVTEDTRLDGTGVKEWKKRRKVRVLFAGTGGSIEETVWDLLEQVSKELRVRRDERRLPERIGPKQSLIERVSSDGFAAFPMPQGTWLVQNHGLGCGCHGCVLKYGRMSS